ncbi:MAG: FGGY family carbohydrate kinase [Chloroflexi bacterium]|nr:FGGY family carbohydrate kinase [Chloroflexota bacterium]
MHLVLDLGSSSTRAMIYAPDDLREPVAMVRAPFSFDVDEHGRSEEHAVDVCERLFGLLDALANEASKLPPIETIGFSSYATSLLCLDSGGAPLTPVFTYADTRSAADARALRSRIDELAVLQRTGCRVRANYWPARLTWLARTRPEIFARSAHFVSLADFLIRELTGDLCTGVSLAAWTGMLDRHTRDWDAIWPTELGVSHQRLPRILCDDEDGPMLTAKCAARWPWLRHARACAPLGDGAAANVGSGCVDRSRIAVTIGTTAAMRIVAPASIAAQPLPPALWNYFVDGSHALIGGATTEGGNVFAWARATLRLPADDVLDAALAALPPDGHGLTVLPTFAGERSPGYAEDIRATIHGLSLKTTPLEILRASMEAIAVRLSTIDAALRGAGVADAGAQLVASGGALELSPTWCQMVADACGAPLVLTDATEASSRGVVEVARWRSCSYSAPTLHGRVFEPKLSNTRIYRAARERLDELYGRIVDR